MKALFAPHVEFQDVQTVGLLARGEERCGPAAGLRHPDQAIGDDGPPDVGRGELDGVVGRLAGEDLDPRVAEE